MRNPISTATMAEEEDVTSIAVCEFFAKCFLALDPPESLSELSDGVEWVTTRQEFLTIRLTLIEAASQVHLSKTEIETLTGLALKTEHNDDSMHSSHQDNLQQSSNISIRSHDYE